MKRYTTVEAFKADESLEDVLDFFFQTFENIDDCNPETPLVGLCGGDIFVAEDADDIEEIVEMAGVSIRTFSDLDMWEVVEMFDDYVMVCEITNNAGGNVFIVPTTLLEDEK